jgi:glycosidase
LSDHAGHPVTLENVPPSQFAAWQKLGFTHVWAMGLWTTGPRAGALARAQPSLRQLCAESFPNWSEADIAGSPYAIADYTVAQSLGGETGLREFRRQLREYGLGLLLDFVPNHLGLDHPWLASRPELFVQSAGEMPESIPIQTAAGPRWLACGKDPYFPAWTDTVQLDHRAAPTRAAMLDILQSVAARCDGVRCDVAMLVLNDVFEKMW